MGRLLVEGGEVMSRVGMACAKSMGETALALEGEKVALLRSQSSLQ